MTFRSDANAAYQNGVPVDKADVLDLWGKVDDLEAQLIRGTRIIGEWNPSSGAFPVTRPDGTPIQAGDQWDVSGVGTVGGISFSTGDILTALVANGAATYAGNWSKREGTATAADQVSTQTPGVSVERALSYSVEDVAELINSATAYQVGDIIHTRRERVSFEVAATGAVNHDSVTAGGVKLYRLRKKRIIVGYSQSNFVGASTGTPWAIVPPSNLFVWNGGHWSGDIEPPIGNAFVPAAQLDPQVPVAYAAELAASFPEDDWYLVIIGRGGTGVRAMTGHRYIWSTATSGAVADRRVRFNADFSIISYSETDINSYLRFSGGNNLGVSTFYPARIQTTLDGGARWIEFRCLTSETDSGTYRNQTISVTDSHNWLVSDGEDVTIFPAAPRMQPVLASVMSAAFSALKLPAGSQKIDKLLIWPTEADISYPDAYRGVDFNILLAKFAPYTSDYTEVLMTLPWPYGTGISVARDAWWNAIRDIQVEDPDRRTLVSLAKSGASNWGDSNNVHVTGSGRESVGRLMRKSEQKGGTGSDTQSGFYTPTITGVANFETGTSFESYWVRNGPVVTVSGGLSLNPVNSGAMTSLRISLPVASDILVVEYLAGMAVADNVANNVASIRGDATNDAALMTYTSGVSTGSYWSFSFTYRVRPTDA